MTAPDPNPNQSSSAPPATVRILKPGDRVGDKYRIQRKLGTGGMGVVYLAVHERLNQNVALKVLHSFHRHSKVDVARFEHEARAMSVVKNPHIARALDADLLDDGSLYLVMECLEGRDLRAEMTRRRTIPYAEAVAYIVQACDGIADVHEAGIVHRDLKPQNLFITQLDRARSIKVLDFGLAKFLQAESVSLTTSGLTVGTPLYMSPEQLCRPDEVSTQSDIWSLGVVLYELIVGISPFQADTPGAVVAAVVLEEPVPLIDAAPNIPKALSDILRKALVKAPAKRLPSARELAALIAPFGMPRDAIRVTSPSQEPASALRRTTLRPELSERIKHDIDAANDSGQHSNVVNSIRRLPALAGVSLPLSSQGVTELSDIPSLAELQPLLGVERSRPRTRRIALSAALICLPIVIGVTWMWLHHRKGPVAGAQARGTPPTVMQPAPQSSESVPGLGSSLPPATTSELVQASGTKASTHPARVRGARALPPVASSSPPASAAKKPILAADGKPLHL